MELQRGVCGDLAGSPHLARAVEAAGVDVAAVRLVEGARAAGAVVAHCTFSILPDGDGVDLDLPVMAAAAASPTLLRRGDPSTELLDGLGPAPGDLVSERHHGLTPFTGTDLGDRLRAAGVDHVVACGVSLNIGIPGLVYEAVGEGFGVTVATDAVVGLPPAFGEAVLANAVGYVARLTTVDQLLDSWSSRR
jgi:nicotinamidase-related amidase